jgi:hypothetical protein
VSDNKIADAFSRCVVLKDEDDEGEAEVDTTEAPREEEVDVDKKHPIFQETILRTIHNELIGQNGSERIGRRILDLLLLDPSTALFIEMKECMVCKLR